MKLRILIVDDHQMMREGLRSILESDDDLEVVGEASSGRESLALLPDLRPDVVLMDVAMRDLNGIDATREIRSRWPGTRVVALSSHGDRRYVTSILDAGADAYVLKSGAYDELRRAIRAVRDGKRYLSADVAGIVVDASLTSGAMHANAPGSASPFQVLAPRERQVLQMIAEGRTSAEIGERLSLSPHTVDTHRRNLMRKLNLHNIADLTRYAIREGLTCADS